MVNVFFFFPESRACSFRPRCRPVQTQKLVGMHLSVTKRVWGPSLTVSWNTLCRRVTCTLLPEEIPAVHSTPSREKSNIFHAAGAGNRLTGSRRATARETISTLTRLLSRNVLFVLLIPISAQTACVCVKTKESDVNDATRDKSAVIAIVLNVRRTYIQLMMALIHLLEMGGGHFSVTFLGVPRFF